MNGETCRMMLAGRRLTVCLPASYGEGRRYPVLYANGGDELERIRESLSQQLAPRFASGECGAFILAAVAPVDRYSEYPPWPAPPLSRKTPPFQGGGDAYLRFLTETAKPAVDKAFCTLPDWAHTGLAGYSLGGLHALYALYRTEAFGWFASLSGSLWYDGWARFTEQNQPACRDARVYLSLGKGEAANRNPRMACVADCTERTARALEGRLVTKPVLEWRGGGHFHEIPERFAAALTWFAAGMAETPG